MFQCIAAGVREGLNGTRPEMKAGCGVGGGGGMAGSQM